MKKKIISDVDLSGNILENFILTELDIDKNINVLSKIISNRLEYREYMSDNDGYINPSHLNHDGDNNYALIGYSVFDNNGAFYTMQRVDDDYYTGYFTRNNVTAVGGSDVLKWNAVGNLTLKCLFFKNLNCKS